jgi:DNA-binding response OmpR family regulator
MVSADYLKEYEMNAASLPPLLSFASEDKNTPDVRLITRSHIDHDQEGASTGSRRSQSALLKVLVVDDDPLVRSMLSDVLKDWGYRSMEAGTVTEALELFRKERPAAILLDLKLPDGSGISVLNKVKRSSPETVVIVVTGHGTLDSAFDAGARRASGFVTKPIDQQQLRRMLQTALEAHATSQRVANTSGHFGQVRPGGEARGGRPQGQKVSPLGKLIRRAMKLLGFSYKNIVSESKRLAALNDNPDMAIGKSTLGNIISGSIRQPGTAKLDSLRIILHLSQAEIDAAIGLQPERRFAEQLQMSSNRTHEVTLDAVTRQRKISLPILKRDVSLNESQFFGGLIERRTHIDVEYLGSFYPPYLRYVVVGEGDTYSSPVAPPGTRLLVNTLLTKVSPAENISFHERELFYVLTPHGLTCSYLENSPSGRVVLVPHPLSGQVRQEFKSTEVTVIGQVVGLLFRK